MVSNSSSDRREGDGVGSLCLINRALVFVATVSGEQVTQSPISNISRDLILILILQRP